MSPLISSIIAALAANAGTIAAAGGIAAGAAGLAHDIQGFVAGKTPWDDTGEWVKGGLKAAGLGFAGGALGAAVGPALGAAFGTTGGSGVGGAGGAVTGGAGGTTTGSAISDAVNIVGENMGTIPQQAGAITPADVAGALPKGTGELLGNGLKAPTGLVEETVKNAAMNAGKQGIAGAATGTMRDLHNPGRGALLGAAGGAASGFASSAVSQMGNAVLKGSGGSVFNPSDSAMNPAPMHGYSLGGSDAAYNPTPEYSVGSMGSSDGFGRAYNPQADAFSLGRTSPAMSPPTLGERFGQGAVNFASRGAGAAARMGVNSMMTPQPNQPEQNPYAQWGVRPYWMERM